jgi:hypothetical protein
MQVMINPGLEHNDILPFTITFNDKIFFLSYNRNTDMISFNCFVDEDAVRIFLQKIVRDYLTNGNRVLYY